jgi:glutamate synthase (NADPH/NADH) small chain
MADPKGFLKHGREVASRRDVAERVHDWNEVYPDGIGRALLPIINTQAGRCMDCGIPFCHQGCPLGNIIPEWNDLVWRDDWDGAMDRLHATNNFPEFTGRLCPAPCETACVLGINQDPVTIKNVEVSIIDRAWGSGYVRPQPPEWLSGKTVAVIGSGPATPSPSTSARTRSAACCATASPSSRWRRSTSTGAWTRCAVRAPSSAPAWTSVAT